jgi:hypothetical protein
MFRWEYFSSVCREYAWSGGKALGAMVAKLTREFFDPSPEEVGVVLIDCDTVAKAQREIISCESCNPERQRSHSARAVYSQSLSGS